MSYKKCKLALARRAAGEPIICDAITHNSETGCRNPNCFKYKEKSARRKVIEIVKKIEEAARCHEMRGCGDPAEYRPIELNLNRQWRQLYRFLKLDVNEAPQVEVSEKVEPDSDDC